MPSETIDQVSQARTPYVDNDYIVIGQGAPPVPLFRGRLPDLVTYVQSKSGVNPITQVGNVNYVMGVNDVELATQVPFTFSPTWTLVAANSIPAGQRRRITDLVGSIGQFSILVSPSGTNTINGRNQSINMSQQYANYEFETDGVSNWTIVAAGPRLLAINNLNDLTNVPAARGNLGIGTAGVHNVEDFLLPSRNLSDLASTTTARNNLGLGALATLSTVFYNNLDASMLATISQLLNATLQKFISSDVFWAAQAPVNIPWAPAGTWDFNTFINATYTLTGAPTSVISIINPKPGQKGVIYIKQDSRGAHTIGPGTVVAAQWPPSFNFFGITNSSGFMITSGTPQISTTANSVSIIEYFVETTSLIHTRLVTNAQ